MSLLAEGPLVTRGWGLRLAGPMPTQAQEKVCSGQDAKGGALRIQGVQPGGRHETHLPHSPRRSSPTASARTLLRRVSGGGWGAGDLSVSTPGMLGHK